MSSNGSWREFWALHEIGQVLDITSQEVGRRLKELGLRTDAGKPTRKAFRIGLCSRRRTADGKNDGWDWHGEMTTRLVHHAGLGQSTAEETGKKQPTNKT